MYIKSERGLMTDTCGKPDVTGIEFAVWMLIGTDWERLFKSSLMQLKMSARVSGASACEVL